MSEIFSTIASAISTAKKLKELSDKARDAEFKNLVADLHLQLAETKTQLADLMQDNTRLKDKIRSLESVQCAPCPSCRKPGWHVEKSERDSLFGEVGGIRRTYKCSFCGFSEEKLVTK